MPLGFMLSVHLRKNDPLNHTKSSRRNVSCVFVDRLICDEVKSRHFHQTDIRVKTSAE